jgi:hypothetical protein
MIISLAFSVYIQARTASIYFGRLNPSTNNTSRIAARLIYFKADPQPGKLSLKLCFFTQTSSLDEVAKGKYFQGLISGRSLSL